MSSWPNKVARSTAPAVAALFRVFAPEVVASRREALGARGMRACSIGQFSAALASRSGCSSTLE